MANEQAPLTHERLTELLHYSPTTGTWTWLKPTYNGRPVPGTIAGAIATISGKKYRYITVDQRHYKSARLAFLYMTGVMPSVNQEVTFRDYNGLNEVYTNLRIATRSQTIASSKKRIDNTSGFKGVSWHEQLRKYEAYIKQAYKKHHLGWFDDPYEAHQKYAEAAQERFGEHARSA